MKPALACAIALMLLSGCAGLEKQLQNRVYCAVDGSHELAFVSWYSRIGIAAKVDDRVDCASLFAHRPASAASSPN